MDNEQIRQKLSTAIELLLSVQAAVDGAAPQFPAEAQKQLEQGICLFCGIKFEPGEKSQRGVHPREYRKMMRRIEKGEVTEDALISQGLIAPQKPPGKQALPLLEEASRIKRESIAANKAAEELLKQRRKKQ